MAVSFRRGLATTLVVVALYSVLVSCTLPTDSKAHSIEGVAFGRFMVKPIAHFLSQHVGIPENLFTANTLSKEENLRMFREENDWKNSLVMWLFPEEVAAAVPRYVQAWFRTLVFCVAVYFIVGAVWAYYIYTCFGDKLFQPGHIPATKDVFEQIRVSMWAMPLYSMLPVITEVFVERGWTLAYARVDSVGLLMYLLYFTMYMTSVEFGVYWMHRGLHEVKWAYKLLHYDHHKYNKEHTLSPFAGLAFHPVDGILQALPYTLTLFFCPMHFITHELLLFATGVWTANIHDCLHANVAPIMGAGYHTIHHTTYKHNYGHYFTYMDALFGTLETPEEHEEAKAAKAAKALKSS